MDPDLDEEWVEIIWQHSVLPYLAEQFFGEKDRLTEFTLEQLRATPTDEVERMATTTRRKIRRRMLEITLKEHKTSPGIALAPADRDALRSLRRPSPSPPAPRTEGVYDLTPGSEVGVVQTETLSVEIRPQLPIDRVLFLISYLLGVTRFRMEDFAFGKAPDLLSKRSFRAS